MMRSHLKTMKRILITCLVALSAGLMLAQSPAAVNIDSSENQAIQEAQGADSASAPAPAPQPAAAPAPQPQPAPAQQSSLPLILAIVALLVAVVALVLALQARTHAHQAGQEAAENLNALKAALKQRLDQADDRQQALEQQLAQRREHAQSAPVASVAPAHQASRPAAAAKPAKPRQVYLTPPDDQGRFGSASPTFELGNSIFVLTTTDGRRGTFQVIDDASVHRLALMMPTENLTRACSGQNIQVSHGAHRVVTDKPGTAVLRSGRWQVEVPAQIHYEA